MENDANRSLADRIRQSIERVYQSEEPERKRIRDKNREQIEIALSGGGDPMGMPATKASQG